jgi:hypothetical protein
MKLVKLKAKNQLTIPQEIVTNLKFKPNELFRIDVEGNTLRIIPMDVEPRLTAEELQVIDRLVENEKGKGKSVRVGKEFSKYIKKLAK